MARISVLDARRGWIRSTGPARHGSGRSSAPLRSHRSRPPVAHRTCAALSRTSTTVRGGVPSPPDAFVADSFMVCRDLSGRAHCPRVPSSRSPSAGCACAARSRLDEPRHSGRTRAGSAQTRLSRSGHRSLNRRKPRPTSRAYLGWGKRAAATLAAVIPTHPSGASEALERPCLVVG